MDAAMIKRYEITSEVIPGTDTWAESSRIQIEASDRGEWCRYEDSTSTAQFQLMCAELDKVKADLGGQLRIINDIIFAEGAALGSDNYFAIRKIVAAHS